MRRLNKSYPYQKPLRNRSSKHLHWLLGQKSILRCVKMDQLKDWMNRDVAGAYEEYNRRMKRIERRYPDKISAINSGVSTAKASR